MDFLTIPNFFQNPDKIRELALSQTFYRWEDNPELRETDSNEIFYWGARTMPLSLVLEPVTYDLLLREYFQKVFSVVKPPSKDKVGFEINCVFHSLTGDERIAPSDLHQDSSSYAGVVYLNDVTDINPDWHGTIILKDGEKVNVPYEYNKLVMYNGKYWHSANAGFGNDLGTSRLTFNMFFNFIK